MRNALRMTGLLGLALILSGCGSSPDSLVEKQIALMNEMADEIENDGTESDIKEIQERLEANSKKLEELEISEDEKARLAEKYKDEMTEVMGRLMKASMSRATKEIGKKFPSMPGFGS